MNRSIIQIIVALIVAFILAFGIVSCLMGTPLPIIEDTPFIEKPITLENINLSGLWILHWSDIDFIMAIDKQGNYQQALVDAYSANAYFGTLTINCNQLILEESNVLYDIKTSRYIVQLDPITLKGKVIEVNGTNSNFDFSLERMK